jgi:hypothetical protein
MWNDDITMKCIENSIISRAVRVLTIELWDDQGEQDEQEEQDEQDERAGRARQASRTKNDLELLGCPFELETNKPGSMFI